MKKYRALYLDIPLIITGGMIIHRELRTDGCNSLNEMVFFIMLKYLFALAFLVIIAIDIIRLVKSRTAPNILAVVVTMIILPLVVLAIMLPKDIFKSNIKIYSTLAMGWKGSLTIREDFSYTVRFNRHEATCYYSGNSVFENDTVILDEELPEETENNFYHKYFLQNNTRLIPFDKNGKLLTDTTTWLTVEKKAKHQLWR